MVTLMESIPFFLQLYEFKRRTRSTARSRNLIFKTAIYSHNIMLIDSSLAPLMKFYSGVGINEFIRPTLAEIILGKLSQTAQRECIDKFSKEEIMLSTY